MDLIAQAAEFPEWIGWVERLGFPGALIVAAILGAWKMAKFLAPIVQSITEKHVELVDTLKDQSTRQTECMEQFGEVQKSHGVILDSHGKLLGDHGNILRDHGKLLTEIHEDVRREHRRTGTNPA